MPTTKAPGKINRTTRQKLLKAIAEPQKIPGAMPNPYRIVLTGLVHVEAGKSISRLCVCTSDNAGNETFFIGMKGTEARCPRCDESHPIVGFKRAVSDGAIDLAETLFCVAPREILGSLFGVPDRRLAALKAATS